MYFGYGLAEPASFASEIVTTETDVSAQVSALRGGDWLDRNGEPIPAEVREAWLADFAAAIEAKKP